MQKIRGVPLQKIRGVPLQKIRGVPLKKIRGFPLKKIRGVPVIGIIIISGEVRNGDEGGESKKKSFPVK